MEVDEQRKQSQEATRVAAEVAAEASKVAKEVAQRAADTAERVSQSVLVFGNDLSYIKKDIADIKLLLGSKYVTTEAFDPIKRIVYGLVGVSLLSVAAAVLTMVVK